jgi:hypothetical protein
MLKNPHMFIVALMIGIGMLMLSRRVDADDWLQYHGGKTVDHYYDGKSLKETGKGVFQLWSKGVEHDAHGAVKAEQPIVLLQVDCLTGTSGILGIYKNGTMSRVRPGVDIGLPVIPESALDALRKKICK